jgi:hypothetical protein
MLHSSAVTEKKNPVGAQNTDGAMVTHYPLEELLGSVFEVGAGFLHGADGGFQVADGFLSRAALLTSLEAFGHVVEVFLLLVLEAVHVVPEVFDLGADFFNLLTAFFVHLGVWLVVGVQESLLRKLRSIFLPVLTPES